jgi:8-oxo-dGTP pyrophosphatase MutT (NUDIX family)
MPHIHEIYDFSIAAFIVCGDKVLLVEHPRYGKWLASGGHIELDENPDEALFREIEEETGLKKVEILSTKPNLQDDGKVPLYTPHYMDVHEANAPHRHIVMVYFGRTLDDQYLKSDEHTDIKWFSKSDLENPKYKVAHDIKFYANEAMKMANNN